MATITWEAFIGAGPAWADIGANTFVMCSSLTDLATNINVGSFQDGNHLGNGDPGTDQCGANHVPNNKYLTDTTFSHNGGGSEALNDTNLTQNESSLRIHFNDAASVSTTNARVYCFDGVTTTTRATGIDMYAFEQGVTATSWTKINDDSAGNGGDNAGQRLDLGNKGPATDIFFYLAVSASPETVGAKSAWDLGVTLTYS